MVGPASLRAALFERNSCNGQQLQLVKAFFMDLKSRPSVVSSYLVSGYVLAACKHTRPRIGS